MLSFVGATAIFVISCFLAATKSQPNGIFISAAEKPKQPKVKGKVTVVTGKSGKGRKTHTTIAKTQARSVAERFRTVHDVDVGVDLTARGIIKRINDGQKGREKDEPYIFVYAGHAASNSFPQGALIGTDDVGVTAGDLAKALKCKQNKNTVMILDSCYSGQVAQKSAMECCTVLTSTPLDGTDEQKKCQANGADTFSRRVYNGMTGAADENKDGKVTLGELHKYLEMKYNGGNRLLYYNGHEKGTNDIVVGTHMEYTVAGVTGPVTLFDPNDEEYSEPVTPDMKLKDCNWIRVGEGGEVKVKRELPLGCIGTTTLTKGQAHLEALEANPGGTHITLEIGTATVEVSPDTDCEDAIHQGIETAAVSVEPSNYERGYMKFSVTVEPNGSLVMVTNDGASVNDLLVTEGLTAHPGQKKSIQIGNKMEFEYLPTAVKG